ncbi:hypothetical protein [Actinomadura montaniterrae]|uniref:Uncharacterized protein n=1 Tax=Actinomadura montaniterrae TaxID=1803903 RepID=A0A6L3W2T2_9ACTN|nr:hypothetical protein [Actinomadura montaniterrae]KAB2384869.1 hypothetical protein F9B16_09610 [Actinomadura montaniterrae]
MRIARLPATGRPDAVLTTDADTLRAVCAHKIDISEAARSGLLHLTGEEDARQRLIDLLLAPFAQSRVAPGADS